MADSRDGIKQAAETGWPQGSEEGPLGWLTHYDWLLQLHTESTAWKLLLESDSSGLEKGIMCHASVKKNYQNYQITRFWDL